MRIKDWLKILLVFCVVLLLFTMPMLSACNGGDGEQEEEEEEEEEVSEFDIVLEAAQDYWADRGANITASDLHALIADDMAPYIVSLRSAASYAAGHIPGAVNVSWGDWDEIPEDEEVLVYCYTGQTGMKATALLGVLGYDAENLRNGMCSWSSDPAVTGTGCFDASVHQGDYNVETTANTVTTTYDYPELNNTTSNDEDAIIAAAVAAVADKYILASDLNIKIAEDEDMTIISVRAADAYAAGHIPGAINIQMDDILDSLDQIDPDAPVYLYCYTGHNAGQAVAILNMLGYDAYSLKYGYCSWSSVNALYCFDASADQSDYEVEVE